MHKLLQAINLIAFVGVAVVNFLAVQRPFFGRTPGDVSDLFPNPFTPPDFTFRIWSVLYLFLGVFVVRQARGLFRKGAAAPGEVAVIGYLFLATCLCNFFWLLAWQSLHPGLAFAFMFLLWALLIRIYYRLATFPGAHWTFTLPFSLYLAWVAVSALANLNVVLIAADFGFFNLTPETWTTILVGLAVFAGLLVLYLNQDPWFSLVLIWALFGVYAKHSGEITGSEMLITGALIGMAILAVGAGMVGIWKWRRVEQVGS